MTEFAYLAICQFQLVSNSGQYFLSWGVCGISTTYADTVTISKVMWGVLVSCPDPQERTEGLGTGAAAMCRRDMPRTRNSNDVKAARVLHDVIRMDK